MEPTLFQVGKQAIFSQDVQDLRYSFYVTPFLILSIDEDVIQINNDEDIKFLYQDLINVTLDACWGIRQSEQHHLVLEVTVSGLKSRFSFVTFFDLYLVVGTGQIQLGEPLCLT